MAYIEEILHRGSAVISLPKDFNGYTSFSAPIGQCLRFSLVRHSCINALDLPLFPSVSCASLVAFSRARGTNSFWIVRVFLTANFAEFGFVSFPLKVISCYLCSLFFLLVGQRRWPKVRNCVRSSEGGRDFCAASKAFSGFRIEGLRATVHVASSVFIVISKLLPTYSTYISMLLVFNLLYCVPKSVRTLFIKASFQPSRFLSEKIENTLSFYVYALRFHKVNNTPFTGSSWIQ